MPENLPEEIRTEMRSLRESVVWVEKAVDVQIAVDMIAMAQRGEYDAAYLLSADGDFTPAVEEVLNIGRKVSLPRPRKADGSRAPRAIAAISECRAIFFTVAGADSPTRKKGKIRVAAKARFGYTSPQMNPSDCRRACRDYERIAAAISYLAANAERAPTLAQTAARAHLSPFYFARVFRRWAGVPPSRFANCLRVEELKRRLAAGEKTLAAALAAGFSGESRAHDALVVHDAMTPGEFRDSGSIFWGAAATPCGRAVVAATRRGVCALRFLPGIGGARAAQKAGLEIRREWPRADFSRDDARAQSVATAIFAGEQTPLAARGTNFQIQVWRALLRIAPGQTADYASLARALGKPGAARAVGGAAARNPVAFLIPCHRVIRASGALGGYRWGITRKAALLAREGAR